MKSPRSPRGAVDMELERSPSSRRGVPDVGGQYDNMDGDGKDASSRFCSRPSAETVIVAVLTVIGLAVTSYGLYDSFEAQKRFAFENDEDGNARPDTLQYAINNQQRGRQGALFTYLIAHYQRAAGLPAARSLLRQPPQETLDSLELMWLPPDPEAIKRLEASMGIHPAPFLNPDESQIGATPPLSTWVADYLESDNFACMPYYGAFGTPNFPLWTQMILYSIILDFVGFGILIVMAIVARVLRKFKAIMWIAFVVDLIGFAASLGLLIYSIYLVEFAQNDVVVIFPRGSGGGFAGRSSRGFEDDFILKHQRDSGEKDLQWYVDFSADAVALDEQGRPTMSTPSYQGDYCIETSFARMTLFFEDLIFDYFQTQVPTNVSEKLFATMPLAEQNFTFNGTHECWHYKMGGTVRALPPAIFDGMLSEIRDDLYGLIYVDIAATTIDLACLVIDLVGLLGFSAWCWAKVAGAGD
eukprot:CAMPEP_0198311260 /NCGR_PEP_ID=MMETSP1450-20131203/3034_1 /TAXON_ID=753684 ORGANISM="Madagascaria erythrocladiodes, Strain CCMP3234" /NCGR_SAMPLE_ID=MMETSP1450 /ASSEMBLY_ACC=CAM_ASM_001115 /LENGTH=469 /DNA_ID=CAMNT_0044014129 /DNA_START=15 /DNA_END=1424 /DNA_ORIENTATION=-